MKTICFVTTNSHKVEEVTRVLSEYGISVVQVREEKEEPKDLTIREVAELNAKKFYEKLKKPVVVEDTGVFFSAYENFPGNSPKMMFSLLGYKGLLKLLEGENRDAEFRAVAGYCDENGVRLFEGVLRGVVSEEVHDPDRDVMPYERIILVNGKPISQMSRDEKNRISHRAEAFRKLGEWLTSRRKA